MIAVEFTEGEIKYNPTISAAFVCSKQTCANTSANMVQTLKNLKNSSDKEVGELNFAMKCVQKSGDTTVSTVDALVRKNLSLKK